MTNNKDIRQRIGAELRATRYDRGLTTRQLEELSGVGHSHIVRIESGRYNVRLDILDKLATALGCDITIKEKNKRKAMKYIIQESEMPTGG